MDNFEDSGAQKRIIPPTISQYQYYVEKWKEFIHVPKIRDGSPIFETSPFQMDMKIPVARCGQFAVAYYWKSPSNEDMVVRFFTRPIDTRDEMRYLAVGALTTDSPYFVNFEYVRYGLWCSALDVKPAKVYPLVLMNRAIGSHLDEFVAFNLGESEILIDVAREWRKMIDNLASKKISHGDLQHGNIIVSPDGKMKLIDYDGVYIDAIAPLGSSECGHPNYNHPSRRNEHFGPLMDKFSQIVIYLSLIAVSHDPEIWTKFHKDDALLFTKEDFRKPDSSAIFSKLSSSRIEIIRNMSNSLKNWCKSSNPLNFQSIVFPSLSDLDVSIILGKGSGTPLKESLKDNIVKGEQTTARPLDWLSLGSVMAPSATLEKPKEIDNSLLELPKESSSLAIKVDLGIVEKAEKKEQKKCLSCGELVDKDAVKCPLCGKEPDKEPMKEENIFQQAIDDCRTLIGDAELRIEELEVMGVDTNDLRQQIDKASFLLQESSVRDASDAIKKGLDDSNETIEKSARQILTDINSLLQSDSITQENANEWRAMTKKAEELIRDSDFFSSYKISKRTKEEIYTSLRAKERQSIIERIKKCENLLSEIDGRGYKSKWGFAGAEENLHSVRDWLSKEDYERSSSTLKEAEQSIEMSYGHYINNLLIANIESELRRVEKLGISIDPTILKSATDSIVSAKKHLVEGDFMSSVMILDRVIPILSVKIKDEEMKQAELTTASEVVGARIGIEYQNLTVKEEAVKQNSTTSSELKPTAINAIVPGQIQEISSLNVTHDESPKTKKEIEIIGKEKTLGFGRIRFRKKEKRDGIKDISEKVPTSAPQEGVEMTPRSEATIRPTDLSLASSADVKMQENQPTDIEPLEFECPECGKLTNTGNVNCPHCGITFGDEVEIASQDRTTAEDMGETVEGGIDDELIDSSTNLNEEPPPPELSTDSEDDENEAAVLNPTEKESPPSPVDTKLQSKVSRDSQISRPVRPNKKTIKLTEIENQFQMILKSIEGVSTPFNAARATLIDASHAIASKNYKKAAKILNVAGTQIETEKRIIAGKATIDNLRSYLSGLDVEESEKQLDSDLIELIEKGKFDESMEIIKKLEMKARSKILKNVDSFFDLALPPDELIMVGRWNTIEVIVLNGSPLAARFLSFEGTSKSGTVEVMENKKPIIQPNSQVTVAVNILPSMQGDMPFEIKAEVEIDGKPIKIKKRASILVVSPPSQEEDGVVNAPPAFDAVQKLGESYTVRSSAGTVSESISAINRINTSAETGGFPFNTEATPRTSASSEQRESRIISETELINGSVDYWSTIIRDCFKDKVAINLTRLSEKDSERIKSSKGYQNLFRSLFTMEFEPFFMWEDWSENKGVVGDESSSRGFKLLFELMLSKDRRIEFEHDNSINSSNKDYFTNTLHILAGYYSLDRNRKREIKRWEIEVRNSEGDIGRYAIVKTVERDVEKGLSKSIFSLKGANAKTDSTNKKVVRRVKIENP